MSVIGSMMLAPRCIDEVCPIVEAEHFYGEANGKVFLAIRDLYFAGKFIDTVTLGKELQRRKQLESIGTAKLVECLQTVPHAGHAVHYAEIVRERADRRAVIESASEMLHAAYDDAQDTEDVLAKAEQSINRLSESRAQGTDAVDLMTVMVDAVCRVEAGSAKGMQTGYPDLDELTTGIHPGQLIVIAARPGVGKSAFACNLAYNMSVTVPTIYFSLEMSRLELAERLICLESQVSLHKMRSGDMDQYQVAQMKSGAELLYDKQIQIDDNANASVVRLASVARYMQRKHKIGMVIVDYLQLVTPLDRKMQREQQVSEMTRALKVLAKSMDVPVIVLAQLNRQIENRPGGKPKLSDLRESGAIEQDADQVWFLHRPAMYIERSKPEWDNVKADCHVYVEKNRSGPTGKVHLSFLEETMRFGSQSMMVHDSFGGS